MCPLLHLHTLLDFGFASYIVICYVLRFVICVLTHMYGFCPIKQIIPSIVILRITPCMCTSIAGLCLHDMYTLAVLCYTVTTDSAKNSIIVFL